MSIENVQQPVEFGFEMGRKKKSTFHGDPSLKQ